jgi:hypothetical protein
MGNHDNCARKVKDWSRRRSFIRTARSSFLGRQLFLNRRATRFEPAAVDQFQAGHFLSQVWSITSDARDVTAVFSANKQKNRKTKSNDMSSISSVASATNPYQTTNQTSYGQSFKDFQAIGSALQSGNLSAAQSALAAFQQNLQSNPPSAASSSSSSSTAATSGPFGSNTQANTDLQSLTSALQSGNTAQAQQAFTSLQTDLKGSQKTHHHHHRSGATSGATASTTTAAATTSSAPASSNASSAIESNGLNATA